MNIGELVPWKPHPEVWILVVTLAGSYGWAMRRLAPHYAPRDKPAVTGSEVAAYLVALSALWAVSDWPLHDIAEDVLDSVHMVEHITIALILPPLVIGGVPGWLWRVVLEPIMALARRITHPIKGLVAFNAVFADTRNPEHMSEDLACFWGSGHSTNETGLAPGFLSVLTDPAT